MEQKMSELKEYQVVWQNQPHCNYPRRVDFVMADSEANARNVVTNHIRRTTGLVMTTIHSVALYEKPTVGYVK
jgi:hypothetical protein